MEGTEILILLTAADTGCRPNAVDECIPYDFRTNHQVSTAIGGYDELPGKDLRWSVASERGGHKYPPFLIEGVVVNLIKGTHPALRRVGWGSVELQNAPYYSTLLHRKILALHTAVNAGVRLFGFGTSVQGQAISLFLLHFQTTQRQNTRDGRDLSLS
jgi:hypothetical protein